MSVQSILAPMALAVAVATAAGCVAYMQNGAVIVHGYAVVDAPNVPPAIDTYQHVWFRGHYAYLVDGYWYYPATNDRWVIFREEPPELYRIRVPLPGASAPPR